MEPEDALQATKSDFVTATELTGGDPDEMREAVEMIVGRYEEYRSGDVSTEIFEEIHG